MIIKANADHTEAVRELVRACFPQEDPRYIDFYYKNVYKPESCFLLIEDGRIVSMLCRNIHEIMFNGRVLQASMLTGMCTHPDYRNRGHMHELMNTVIDACEHTELITLVQSEDESLYEPYGFRTVYNRTEYLIRRKDVSRITNFGCAYEVPPIDMLKVYSAYISRFNGFYPRTLDYFVNYRKQLLAMGGKMIGFYDGKDRIRGYATVIPQGTELRVDELIYLDSLSLNKLCNACLQERPNVHLYVSEAEKLHAVFPDAVKRTYGSTMARLNDADLFGKLFGAEVHDVKEAFAITRKPLNLNESY